MVNSRMAQDPAHFPVVKHLVAKVLLAFFNITFLSMKVFEIKCHDLIKVNR